MRPTFNYALRFFALLSFTSAFAGPEFDAMLKGAHWKTYLQCLQRCQKENVGLYQPIDLIRIDLLPEKEFLRQVTTYSSQWAEIEKLPNQFQQKPKLYKVSCEANSSLDELWRRNQRTSKRSLKGSTIKILNAIPSEMRTGLSPIDGVFLKSSAVGKKVFEDLSKKPQMNLEAVVYDEQTKTIRFEGQPGAWANLNLPPKPYYDLSVNLASDGSLRFKGNFVGSSEPVGSDLRIKADNLQGTLFNQRAPASSGNLPFGLFPQTNQRFIDETGLSHFEGDGHNHSH